MQTQCKEGHCFSNNSTVWSQLYSTVTKSQDIWQVLLGIFDFLM